MVSDRPYRKALTHEAAFAELLDNAGAQFDPAVVEAFVASRDEIERLLMKGPGAAQQAGRVLATVLFTDIVGSTGKAAEMGDTAYRDLLTVITPRCARCSGATGATRSTWWATASWRRSTVRRGRSSARPPSAASSHHSVSKIRAGCHTGEIEVTGAAVRGIAVHIGARVAALAEPGEILVSSIVRDLVAGSGLVFTDRGEHELKACPASGGCSRSSPRRRGPAEPGRAARARLAPAR